MPSRPMRIDILTLFPQMFDSVLGCSMLKRALDKGVFTVNVADIRDFSAGDYRKVDDKPYGGGPGMVMMPGPVYECFEHVRDLCPDKGRVILLTPQGRRFSQKDAVDLAGESRLILIAGRYEGFDERIRTGLGAEQLSVGDYVLSGGELAAMVVMEAVVRLLGGALGDESSTSEETFNQGLLEYPQYTRPEVFRGMKVPEVLLSGDHSAIRRWRRKRALERTSRWRPDLLEE